jgi:hypothetical protein
MGLEYITQPQVFLAPITAVNGIQGVNNPFPLLTTYQSWVSTGTVNTSAFPIPGTWTMLDAPGSFIVTVGNVIQSPTDYSIDRNNRILTFSSIITAGIEVGVTQLATASPSATSFNSIQAVSGNFTNLSAINGNVNNLFVNNLTALSATINVIDITVYELSGFRATGNLLIDGITTTNTLSAVSTTTQNFSSRFINLEHSTPNDGVNPVLFIGERGDGSGGTVTGSLTGYNVTYSETANRLLISTQLGAVAPLTAVSIDSTGNVGIGTDRPGSNLTVVGNISSSGNITGYNTTIFYHATGFGTAPLTITPYFSAAAGFITFDPFRRYRLVVEAFYTKAATAGTVTFTLSSTVPFVYATGSLVHSALAGYTGAGAAPVHTAGVVASAATLAFSPGSIGGAGVTNHYGSFTYYIETSSVPTVANLFVTTALGGAINPGRGSYWQETVIG